MEQNINLNHFIITCEVSSYKKKKNELGNILNVKTDFKKIDFVNRYTLRQLFETETYSIIKYKRNQQYSRLRIFFMNSYVFFFFI